MRSLLLAARFGLALFVFGGSLLVALPAADDQSPAGVTAVLKGHAEAIYAVTYMPGGKHVVTGSFDSEYSMTVTTNGEGVQAGLDKRFKATGHQNGQTASHRTAPSVVHNNADRGRSFPAMIRVERLVSPEILSMPRRSPP